VLKGKKNFLNKHSLKRKYLGEFVENEMLLLFISTQNKPNADCAQKLGVKIKYPIER